MTEKISFSTFWFVHPSFLSTPPLYSLFFNFYFVLVLCSIFICTAYTNTRYFLVIFLICLPFTLLSGRTFIRFVRIFQFNIAYFWHFYRLNVEWWVCTMQYSNRLRLCVYFITIIYGCDVNFFCSCNGLSSFFFAYKAKTIRWRTYKHTYIKSFVVVFFSLCA